MLKGYSYLNKYTSHLRIFMQCWHAYHNPFILKISLTFGMLYKFSSTCYSIPANKVITFVYPKHNKYSFIFIIECPWVSNYRRVHLMICLYVCDKCVPVIPICLSVQYIPYFFDGRPGNSSKTSSKSQPGIISNQAFFQV